MIVYLFFPLAIIISSSLGILISPKWALAPFVWVLVIVPIIDLILPNLNNKDENLNETKLHNLALIIILPGILFLIVFLVIVLSEVSSRYINDITSGIIFATLPVLIFILSYIFLILKLREGK